MSSLSLTSRERAPTSRPVHFSTFDVTEQAFYVSSDSTCAAIVNLKPIVPGHVLVITRTLYRRLSEVPADVLATLFKSVQEVAKGVEHIFDADAVTISIQDGEAAGQTVPHLHVHILPRRKGDIQPKDRVYELLEEWGFHSHQQQQDKIRVDADEDRRPRSASQMRSEAQFLAAFFDNDGFFDASRLVGPQNV